MWIVRWWLWWWRQLRLLDSIHFEVFFFATNTITVKCHSASLLIECGSVIGLSLPDWDYLEIPLFRVIPIYLRPSSLSFGNLFHSYCRSSPLKISSNKERGHIQSGTATGKVYQSRAPVHYQFNSWALLFFSADWMEKRRDERERVSCSSWGMCWNINERNKSID